MKTLIILTTLCTTTLLCFGQPYQIQQYSYSVDSNIEYGQATDFAGNNDTLLLDIYKPIGDNNCFRPCMILVHGGAWIGGSKEDVNISALAENFTERGWVVAAVNYRLGMHKTSNYSMYPLCNDQMSIPCAYISDSAEVFRAIYRGQQDVKGAIRYMKNRSAIDSTDLGSFFVAGESAGGFNAFAAAFMNDPSEKPSFCEAIQAAPTPDPDLVSCLPASYDLNRPDLGDINGTLNIGGYDATVEGVGSIYGGVLNLDMFADETDWPAIFMYHQKSDVVVNHDYGRLLGRIDWECFSQTNICQNYAKYPSAYGSTGIFDYFSEPGGPVGSTPISYSSIDNYEYLNDCFDNGHSIANFWQTADQLAYLFAMQLVSIGNTSAPCFANLNEADQAFDVSIYPNPSSGSVTLENFTGQVVAAEIYMSDGKMVVQKNIETKETLELENGAYVIRYSNGKSAKYTKLIIN